MNEFLVVAFSVGVPTLVCALLIIFPRNRHPNPGPESRLPQSGAHCIVDVEKLEAEIERRG